MSEKSKIEAGADDRTAAHPEAYCQRCGGPNMCWFVASEIWNQVVPDDGILCPICFVALAEAYGIAGAWELKLEGRDD